MLFISYRPHVKHGMKMIAQSGSMPVYVFNPLHKVESPEKEMGNKKPMQPLNVVIIKIRSDHCKQYAWHVFIAREEGEI